MRRAVFFARFHVGKCNRMCLNEKCVAHTSSGLPNSKGIHRSLLAKRLRIAIRIDYADVSRGSVAGWLRLLLFDPLAPFAGQVLLHQDLTAHWY